MSFARTRVLIRQCRLPVTRISSFRSFSSSSLRRDDDEVENLIRQIQADLVSQSPQFAGESMPDDSDSNVLKDLQSLHGEHLDSFIERYLDKVLEEEEGFQKAAEGLSKALEGFDPASTAKFRKELAGITASEGNSGELSGESGIQELDSSTPAERVIDLLDRAVTASQPLLARLIQGGNKDLNELLAELESDEALSSLGREETLRRALIPNPNTLNPDLLSRRSSASPSRVLLEGRNGLEEGEWSQDAEEQVQQQIVKWMKEGESARGRKGRKGLWSRRQRQEMAQLLEQAQKEAPALIEDSSTPSLTTVEEGKVPIDLDKLKQLEVPEDMTVKREKWFTTTPSVGLLQPKTIERTHSIPVASIHFRSHFPHLLSLQLHLLHHTAYLLGIPVSKGVPLPTKRTLITVLRSPFVHKKSMENWERRVYKRGVKVWDCQPEVLKGWMAYLERNAIAGVGMRITRWEWVDTEFLQADEGVSMKEKEMKVDPAISAAAVRAPKGALEAAI